MKVLFNVGELARRRTGIGLYVQNLLEQSRHDSDIDSLLGMLGNRLLAVPESATLLAPKDGGESPSILCAHWLALLCSLPGTYSARQALRDCWTARPLSKLSQGRYIYHDPNFVPLRYDGPLVITLHDVSHVRYPQFHPAMRVAFLYRRLPEALKRADCIIVDSHFVAAN